MDIEQNERNQKTIENKSETAWSHIFSFLLMILLTAAAFYLVATNLVRKELILPFILFFALIQVFLQLFTFMHLNQKGSAFYTMFILIGLLIAIISASGIIFM